MLHISTSVCSSWEDTFVKAGSPSGTLSPGMAAHGLPPQRPGPGRARQWVVPPSGLGGLSPGRALSTLAGSPGCSTTQQLGPLEKGRAVEQPPPIQAHSGIHTRRVPRSALGPPPPPCPSPPHPRRRIGFLRCCDPVLLPLIKMLSDTGLVLWVSSFLGVGRARACVLVDGGGLAKAQARSSACSSLPTPSFFKRGAQRCGLPRRVAEKTGDPDHQGLPRGTLGVRGADSGLCVEASFQSTCQSQENDTIHI